MFEPSLDALPRPPSSASTTQAAVHYVNAIASEVLGWSRDEIIGRSVLDLPSSR